MTNFIHIRNILLVFVADELQIGHGQILHLGCLDMVISNKLTFCISKVYIQFTRGRVSNYKILHIFIIKK